VYYSCWLSRAFGCSRSRLRGDTQEVCLLKVNRSTFCLLASTLPGDDVFLLHLPWTRPPVGRLYLGVHRMDLSLAHVPRGLPSSFVNILTSGLASAGTLPLIYPQRVSPTTPRYLACSQRQCSTCASSVRHVSHTIPARSSCNVVYFIFSCPAAFMLLPCHL
jgi:hypothetical protein